MAKRYHPDSSTHTDSEDPHMSSGSMSQEKKKERFQQVQMAYEILSCEQKRQEYDSYQGRSYYENQFEENTQGPKERESS